MKPGLRDLNQALKHWNVGRQKAGAHYEQWVGDLWQTKYINQYHQAFVLDQSPTDAQLEQAATEGFKPIGSNGWQHLCDHLRVGISVEILGRKPVTEKVQ